MDACALQIGGMMNEYWYWVNDNEDEVWITLNDNGNIEIAPEAFEELLWAAGFEPVG